MEKSSSKHLAAVLLSLGLAVLAGIPASRADEPGHVTLQPVAPDRDDIVAPSPDGAPVDSSSPGSEPAPHDGAFGRFMHDHGWRLLETTGGLTVANYYRREVGYSRKPLLFEETPGFDKAIRATFATGNDYNSFINLYSLQTLRYGVPLVVIGIDFGSGREMADDLLGFVNAVQTNRGATEFLKDVVGRHRPGLQFADPNEIGLPAYNALNDNRHYHHSFPSGHASGSFTMLSYMERVAARKFGMRSVGRKITFGALYGLAGFIAWTRIDRDEHFFSDIVAGATLGTWEGRTFYRLEHPEEFGKAKSAELRWRTPRVIFHPPQIWNGGAAMTVSLRLGADSP